jgi:hypothetical protein
MVGRSLLASVACALACGVDPPAFPGSDSATSEGTMQADDGGSSSPASSNGSADADTIEPGTTSAEPSTGGSTGPSDDDTSTGAPPDPIVCRDPDGLCHAPVDLVPVGTAPGAIAAGDLDGDGALDLVVAETQELDQAQLAVLLGAGDGTFSPPQWTSLAPGNGAASLVIAPFDGDASLDVAVALEGSGEVMILLGDGQGGLEPALSIAVGSSPQWLVSGDFDVDGVLDLAVAVHAGFRLAVLHGLGASSVGFAPQIEQPLGYRPTTLVPTMAFNGLLGLVVASRTDNRIELLAGSVMGPFVSLASLNVEAAPVHADVVDLDADGLLDIVSVHRNNNGRVYVRRGVADGQWGFSEQYEGINGPTDAVLADMNVDGLPDIVACADGEEGVAILQGQPDGSFALPVVYPSALNQERLVVADLDGDRVPDVASTGQSPGAIYIVLSHAS